jgi:uncharacterized protein (DUF305 family)
MNKLHLLPALATGTLLFAACGGDDADSGSTNAAATTVAGSATTVAGASSDFNDADVEFAQGMIGHHEQAVEMAEIALDPTRQARPEVLDLAARIQAAQDPEIELMTSWLTAWGESVEMDTSEGHNMEDMEGMMSADEMDELAAATGPEFDTMWLKMMVEHHEGAISQSNDVKAEGSNPDVLALADQIIIAQQGEISEMQALLG